MMEIEKDGAAVRIPPPLVYLAGIIAGAGVHALVAPLPLGMPTVLRIALSLACAVVGLGFAAAAIGLFRRTGQDPKPWQPTPEIISTGVYKMTRNPMYLGMALLQAAVGIGLANGWIVIFVPVVLGVVYLTAVRHEEDYLQRKFADEYTRYKASVRRWI
jgi:protein-S-isoprenylcysteine O-methyltransferase Ste14